MGNKDKILSYYFSDTLSMVEIATKLGISKQYVSKIIRKDNRYTKEKADRQALSKEKQRERVKQYIYNRREKEKNERLTGMIEQQHIQASRELSGRKTINNRAYRNWNSSIYEFNNNTKEYKIKNEYKNKVSYAIPKKIKWN